jgi:hypothetical protein
MKRYGFLIALVIMFSFLVNVNAISLITFRISTDKSMLKEGETFDLKIYAESEGDLSPDTTCFHIEYDLDVFEFVSYDGKADTGFNEIANYLYVEDGAEITSVSSNELVGTLKLKVKDNVDVNNSSIIYRTTYESVLNNGSVKINIDEESTTADNDENTNSIDKESNNSNETNKVLIYLSIFLSLITISSAITTFYVIKKSKKIQ